MKKYRVTTHLLAIALTTTSLAIYSASSTHKHYGKNAPFTIADLPPSSLKTKLQALSADRKKKSPGLATQNFFYR